MVNVINRQKVAAVRKVVLLVEAYIRSSDFTDVFYLATDCNLLITEHQIIIK